MRRGSADRRSRCFGRPRSTTSSGRRPRSGRCSRRSRRRSRSTSSCTVRPASARRPSRGSRSRSRSCGRTRRLRATRPSSKRAARRCAGIRARRRTRCSAAYTIRSIKVRAASSPRVASPNPNSASSRARTAACSSSTSSVRWMPCCKRSCSKCSKISASRSNRRITTRPIPASPRTSRSSSMTARRPTSC